MESPVRTRSVALTLAVVAACVPTDRTDAYDSEIGVEAVSLTPGELDGTWLGQLELSTIIELPVVGSRTGGANSGRLLTLRWDQAAETYHVRMTWCWADVFEVEGVSNRFDDVALAALEVLGAATVDHPRGRLRTERVLDIWGLRHMPDPFNDPVPTRDNYRTPPQRDWVWDQDGDGHPGVTVHMSGTVRGDGYVVARTVFRLEGVARSPDEVVGLYRAESTVQRMLDSTISVMGVNQSQVESSERPDPNPKNSWFQMVRGADDATCDDVREARADGRLASRRPF